MSKVFVYGTLKRGYHNHRLLIGTKFLGVGILHDYGVFNMSVGFPGIKYSEGNYVVGEVYEVSDITLANLDILEGYYGKGCKNNMYNRLNETIRLENGEDMVVGVYEWNSKKPPTEEFIPNGKWFKVY